MFNLEQAVEDWRRELAADGIRSATFRSIDYGGRLPKPGSHAPSDRLRLHASPFIVP